MTPSKEHLIEIKIIQPGRATGQYYAVDTDTLRLEKIILPDQNLPFDLAILPTALTSFHEPFAVFVFSAISHPINTEMETNLLGAVQRGSEEPLLLVAPTVDEHAPQSLDEIKDELRGELQRVLQYTRPGEWRFLDVEEAEKYLHAAALRYRQQQAAGKLPRLDPAWQPIYVHRPSASFAETDHYTAAEYTFYELPHRFQHYVSEYLAPDERILYASRRPAMTSYRKGSWLRREPLQEGVLILTNQRLIQLAELVPPDSANIRYGFHTIVGTLERLSDVTLAPFGENLLLQTKWQAAGGEHIMEWEAPEHIRDSLEELTAFLSRFKISAEDYALRRATLPAPPKKLPALEDSAAHHPDEWIPVNKEFSAMLKESLEDGERARAWALLPKWFEHKQNHRSLVVTEQRVFMLPNHSINIALAQIATLEYTGSILASSLVINHFENDKLRQTEIPFPYPTQDSFRICFEAARRCMAVLPL